MKHLDYLVVFLCLAPINHVKSASNRDPSNYPMKLKRELGNELPAKWIGSSRVRGLTKEQNVFGGGSNDFGRRGKEDDARGKRMMGKKGMEGSFSYETIKEPDSQDETISDPMSEDYSEEESEDSQPSKGRPTDDDSEEESEDSQPSKERPTPTPTPSPSPHPTKELPEPTPTHPSEAPKTPKPTSLPTPKPTKRQTEEPASPSVHATTKFPTRTPTFSPTNALPQPVPPTTTVAPRPTQPAPTTPAPTAPAPMPIQRPTASTVVCQADGNGDFGYMLGDTTEVAYLYQMELFPGVTTQEATAQIGKQIVNALLPELFPTECAPLRRLQSVDAFDQSELYTGITAAPQDTLATGFECVGVFLDPCFVVQGFVSVFSQGITTEVVELEVSTAIHDILENGIIEKELIDVDKVSSLRDPSSTVELLPQPDFPIASGFPIEPGFPIESVRGRTNPFVGYKSPTPTPAPSLRNYYQPRYPSQPTYDVAAFRPTMTIETSSTSVTPEYSSEVVTSSYQDSQAADEKPIILFTLPWWIWLGIAIWLLVVLCLKMAVSRLLQKQKQYTKP